MSLALATNPYRPQAFPATWASEWGQDEIGLWMTLDYKGVQQVFRWLLPGRFEMGSANGQTNEQPVHRVQISQGFWLAETTVTQALWQVVMGESPSRFKGESLPVDSVSWEDAQVFIQTLRQQVPNLPLRLPTEAQWEYACRAGTQTAYSFGDNITQDQAHFSQHEFGDAKSTIAVKAKPANTWGLYQMHGNIWEWCADGYQADYYQYSPNHDPQGPSEPHTARVLRGGSWFSLKPENLRSAGRRSGTPGNRPSGIGFRLSLA